jgi:hypothetical protein
MTDKLPEIFYLEKVAQQDVFTNLVSDLKKDVWQYGVTTINAAGFGVEDDAKFWNFSMVSNRWNEVLFQDIVDKLELLEPRTKNYNFKSLDVVAGGKTFGLDGNIHIDREFEFSSKGDGYMTFCYFPNEEWHPEWGGELQFFDQAGNVIASYYPMPDTCIVFDSNIPHRGLAPSRNCTEPRKFISFKVFVNKMSEE